MDRAIMNARMVLLLYHRYDEHSLLKLKRKLRLTRKQTASNCLTITRYHNTNIHMENTHWLLVQNYNKKGKSNGICEYQKIIINMIYSQL